MRGILLALVAALAAASTAHAQQTTDPADPNYVPPAGDQGFNDPDMVGDPADDGPSVGAPGDQPQSIGPPGDQPQSIGPPGDQPQNVSMWLWIIPLVIGLGLLGWFVARRSRAERAETIGTSRPMRERRGKL